MAEQSSEIFLYYDDTVKNREGSGIIKIFGERFEFTEVCRERKPGSQKPEWCGSFNAFAEAEMIRALPSYKNAGKEKYLPKDASWNESSQGTITLPATKVIKMTVFKIKGGSTAPTLYTYRDTFKLSL